MIDHEDWILNEKLNPHHEDYSGPDDAGELFLVLERVCTSYAAETGEKGERKKKYLEIIRELNRLSDMYNLFYKKTPFGE